MYLAVFLLNRENYSLIFMGYVVDSRNNMETKGLEVDNVWAQV
ncbi:MAG: hypothetical protein R6U35_02445 [Candidatus Humimicrobiaceae bacterium]